MRTFLLVSGIAAAGCFSRPEFSGSDAAPDAASPACRQFGGWGTATPISPRTAATVNTLAEEVSPWMSPERTELLFWSSRSPEGLHLSTRPTPTAPWGTPVRLPLVVDTSGGAALSDNGQTIWFNRDQEIYTATRQGTGFVGEQPISLNPLSFEGDPEVSSNGLTMFLSGGPDAGDLRLNDLHTRTRTSTTAPWDPASPVTELRAGELDCCPTISGDGSQLMWMHSDANRYTIMESLWDAGQRRWGAARAVPELDNFPHKSEPHLSRDGRSLVYSYDEGTSYDLAMIERRCSDPADP